MKKTVSIQTRIWTLILSTLLVTLLAAAAVLCLLDRYAPDLALKPIGLLLLAFAAGLTLIVSVLAAVTMGRVASSLKTLTKAVQRLSKNGSEVELKPVGIREIDALAAAIEALTDEERIQRALAYRDSLTGLRNANSYNAWARDFDAQIKDGTDGVFGLMVIDINDLKVANDRFGHDVGNQIIAATADMLKGVFGRSPIFRIGGDEFLVILQDRDLLRFADLLDRFTAANRAVSVTSDGLHIPVTMAYGTAIFDPSEDRSFTDVFHRADAVMYEQKRKMKA